MLSLFYCVLFGVVDFGFWYGLIGFSRHDVFCKKVLPFVFVLVSLIFFMLDILDCFQTKV